MITIDGLRKSFPGGAGLLFDGISETIGGGQVIGIAGPSGCGKSTFLRIIAGIESFQGRIEIDGLNPDQAKNAGGIGLAFQDASLLPWMTVGENLKLPFQVLKRRIDDREIKAFMRLLNISGTGLDRPDELSGGMAKRASLARAMVYKPKLLLLDEPFGAIDWPLRQLIMRDLANLWRTFHPTVLIVSHEIRELAFLSDQIWIMKGSPATFSRKVPVEFPHRTINLFRNPQFLAFCSNLEQWTA